MNYYQAVEKKPEHGGGWAFMQLNRREGALVYCKCATVENGWGWGKPGEQGPPGHATDEEAERCFWEREQERGIRWSTQGSADRCAICEEWTPDLLHAVSNLVDPFESVCRSHFPDDEAAARWLWGRHPFRAGIQIVASW